MIVMPFVELDGVEYGQRGQLRDAEVLADISVEWGRSNVFDQQDSATANITLVARNPAVLAESNYLGAPVNIYYQALPAGRAEVTDCVCFFRGFVTEQEIIPRTDNPESGHYVELSCSDIRAQLENVLINRGNQIGAEPMQERPVYLTAEFFKDTYDLLEGDGYSPIPMPAEREDEMMFAVPFTSAPSMTDILDEVYYTASCVWAYNPDTRKIDGIEVRPYSSPGAMILHMPDAQGEYVIAHNWDGTAYPAIPARFCVSDGVMTRSASNELTEVRTTWVSEQIDDENPDAPSEKVAETTASVRNYKTSSMDITVHRWAKEGYTDTAENFIEVADMLRRKPVPSPVTFSTRLIENQQRTASVENDGNWPDNPLLADMLLTGTPLNRPVVISGMRDAVSGTSPAAYSIISASIHYYKDSATHPGYWEVEFQPVPIVEAMPDMDAITWPNLPDDATWNDTARIANTVSWADLRYIED